MFSSLFWLWPTVFRSIEPDEPLDLSSYQNASAIDSLVSQLQAELVPPPLAVSYPMKTFHPPPQAGKDFSLNPAAVLGSRQTSSCTGGADNYCFAANPGSYCPNCGTCCTQASGGWCCASTGAFCCATAVDGTSGGCCVTGAICDSNGCSLPVVTTTSTVTSWATVYDYVTQAANFVQTVYYTVTITSSTTVVDPITVAKAKMAKRTASIDEERGPTHTVHASKPQETSIKISPEIPTATILSSPNFDLVEHRLQEMGLLVKRASTVTSTVYTTVPATTTLISSIFLSATSTTYATTTEIAYVTFTQTSSIIGSQSSQPGQTGTPISGGSSGQQSTPGQNSASGLSTGAKAGIGVASAAGSSIICVIIIIWWRWRGKKDDAAEGGPVGAAMASPVANDNKSYTSPQTQSPNYSPYPQHGQTYPQQNQGYPQHVSQEYNQNYQQYPQYNQGYPPHQQWEPPSLSPTSGPDPSAMPFEVGGQSMFPYEMPPDPSVHEMQSSPIMRVASPTRKPVGSGMGRM